MELKTLETLHEQYESFKMSIKSDKMGTETEPGWNHSPAKEVLNKMLETISSCLQTVDKSSKDYNRLLAMQGALYYQHAKVLVQLGQMDEAQEILKTCIDFLKDSFLVPEITFLGLRALNHYCYLLTKCGDLTKSQSLLELAEAKYLELKESGDISTLPLYSNDDLFEAKLDLTPNKEINEKLERLVTNNLQMLGYVYNKQGDLDKFAVHHHQVLRRQLEMREGDATVWAMKTARLGYFFLTRNKFAQARHHLAAACYVLSQYENTLKTLEPTELVLSKWDELNHRYADIAKCWVRYGLFLFNASKMKLVSAFYGDSSSFLDNSWANPFDNFLYGCNDPEENEETSVWNGSESKTQEEELHNSLGTTNLKELEKGFVTGAEIPTKKESVSFPTSDVFDVIFENSNPSNISIGMVGPEFSQSASAGAAAATATAAVGANEGIENSDNKPDGGEEGKNEPEADELNFRFPNLELNCFENCVSCNYVDSLQSARALFLFTHSWLKKSKLFYTLKDHPMEYVNVILDLSELYRYLAFYEEDIENQYSVQKRRADTLETLSAVLKEVRPQCYIAISIELFRELAEIHLELMGLNLRRLYLAQPEGPKEGEGKSSNDGFDSKMEELMKEMRTRYWRARGLVDKSGHKRERYSSKVEAQTILSEMRYLLTDILKNPDLELMFYRKLLGMLVVTVFDLGMIAVEMGDITEALNCLDEVLVMIPDGMSRPSPNYVLISVEARNVFGAEYVDVNPRVAAKMIDEADKIYYNYMKIFPKKDPYSHEDHFEEVVNFQGGDQLVKAHSLTKFFLRQYSRPVTYFYKSLGDCYEALRVMATTEITDLSARAEIAIILGEYFINEREFHYGRYLLSIAAYIIDKYEDNIKELEEKMGATKIREMKARAGITEEVKKRRQTRWISTAPDERKKEAEPSAATNEILVEVEERNKEAGTSMGTNEILVEVEERKEDMSSTEEVDERDQEAGPSYERHDRKHGRDDVQEENEREQGTWIEYEEPTVEEEIKGWRAYLARAWVKYGLHLMKFASQTIDEPRVEITTHLPMFPKMKKVDLSGYENLITDEFPKTKREAELVFLFTQYKIVEAKEYYTLFSYPHEHVALAQEHSLLIRYMMKYEDDNKALRKYLKARIRMLEPLSLQLNYKYYLPGCRLLWFELGKCYHELLLLKYDNMNSKEGDAMRKTIQRINDYCSTGMVHLHNYIDSFRNKKFQLPDPVPAEAVAKLAFAHFYLGRMYHAYITYDQEEANEYTLIAFSCFRYVVKHCERDEAMMEALKYQYETLSEIRVGCYKDKLLLVRYQSGS